jgi:crotonobetainyl-CoA:carnitine CoA-transferase CaiB-like acyl-CoA transferase
MTGRPMQGVRVVEVAQYTFVPAAGAVLADWGAEVIKIEHAVTGDHQRGLVKLGLVPAKGTFAPIMEHPNRSKRSIGLALEHPEGLEILHELLRWADVFTTNFLPDARTRLKIDVDDVWAVNPRIIYARGSALGARGPGRTKGGYDQSTYWCRGGSSAGVTPADVVHDGVCAMPAPAYGDSIGAMHIAGGIAAALFARERTGEPSVVDVSLLSTGAWANALAVDISMITGEPWLAGPVRDPGAPMNPLSRRYRTSDDRWIQLSMLQGGRYWADFCVHLGRPELAGDERFNTDAALSEHADEAGAIIAAEIASAPLAEWTKRFDPMEGPWDPVQNSLEVGHDEQLRANGFMADVVDVEGNTRQLVTAPVQFDETPATPTRGPQFAEHTDEILAELGLDPDRIIELKIAGAVT